MRTRGYLHLKTGVSFLIVSITLVCANTRIREAEVLRLFPDCALYGYGWPTFSIEGFPRAFPAGTGVGIYFVEQWQFAGFAINLFTAALILAALTVCSEWLVRKQRQRHIAIKKPGG